MSKKKKSKYRWFYEILSIILITIVLGVQSYWAKKSENFATKEDIGDITKIVEDVKSEIQEREMIKGQRRVFYTDLSESMIIFLKGNNPSTDDNKYFQKNYSKIWIWDKDSTIIKLNKLIDLKTTTNFVNYNNLESDQISYAEIMLHMRKEIVPDTKLSINDYRFFIVVNEK